MLPEPPGLHHFTVVADYSQFYLQDLDAHESWMRSHTADDLTAPAGWTHEAVQIHRIGVQPHSIAVGTARIDLVETTLHFHPAAPTNSFRDAEHVVEADIAVPNGDLAIYSPADDPGQERHININAGHYRVRASYIPSGPPTAGSNDAEYGDHFLYRLDLWPTDKPAPLTVSKQGPSPWAG